jgi:hypothetical protein
VNVVHAHFRKYLYFRSHGQTNPKPRRFQPPSNYEKHEAHQRESQPLTNQLLEHTIEATSPKQTSLRMPERPEKDGKQQAQQMELPAQDAGRTVKEQPVSSPVHQTQFTLLISITAPN